MKERVAISAGRAFLYGLATLLYLALSLAIFGGVAPAMVSSSDSTLVIAGFALAAIWLLATGAITLHLVNRHLRNKDAKKEAQQ